MYREERIRYVQKVRHNERKELFVQIGPGFGRDVEVEALDQVLTKVF